MFGRLDLTEKSDGGDFNEDDGTVIAALATAAGTAIDNALLHSGTRERETRVDASGEITEQLVTGVDTDQALRLMAQRARSMSGAGLAAIAAPEETAPG